MGGTQRSTAVRRRCAAVVLAMVALTTVGATASLAAPAPRPSTAGTALEACQALVDGTYEDGSRVEEEASRTCATACGMLADSRRNGRAEEPELVLEARQACADACSYILEEGLELKAKNSGPIALAVQACWIVLTTSDDALPMTDNSGRRWK